MKTNELRKTMTMAAAAATLTCHAADLTVTQATNLTADASYGSVYVNAPLTLTGAKLTLTGSGLYLPGENGVDASLTATGGGTLGFIGSPEIFIGERSGKGHMTVQGNMDFNTYHLTVGGSAVVDDTGYIDFLRIQSGLMSDGQLTRIYVDRWTSYKKRPARVLFNGSSAMLALRPSTEWFLWADSASASWVFEGINGADVMFGMSGWWSAPTYKNLLHGNTKVKFRTQGDCDVVFLTPDSSHKHAFVVNYSTNQVEWTHSGATVISNGCILRATADYALPNGPQTGSIALRGMDARAVPVLDLCGTTQIANGVVDSSPAGAGTITNSSATAATLVLGAHNQDCDLVIGRVSQGVTIEKAGSGVLTVVATNLPSVNVTGGAFMVSGANLSCDGLAQNGGAVGVVSGATLDLSGAPSGSNALSHIAVTDGAGGGTFRGATLAASGVIDLSTATPTAEGFGEDTLAVSFANCANPENIQNWTVRVNGAGGNSLGAKISGGNLRIGKTATVIMMR